MQESLLLLKALADQTRLTIINTLVNKPAYLEDLSEHLDLAPSTLSFHLKKLTDAGVVKKKKQQYYVEFELDEQVLDTPLKDLILANRRVSAEDTSRQNDFRQQVLNSFFKDNRLVQIPKKLKKRMIVLQYLAAEFEPETEYPEVHVNEVIQNHHDDYCEIRRMLVDYGVMKRENGLYWRVISKKDEQMRKEELKKAYKETPRDGGIFQIRNKITGKRFLGKSLDIEKVFNRHRAQLSFGAHRCTEMQQEFNENGLENFAFEVLTVLERTTETDQQMWDDLNELEKMWYEKLDLPEDKFYKIN